MENDVYIYNINKKTSTAIQVRIGRRIVAIPVPKPGNSTVVEVTAHMSNTLKTKHGYSSHTKSPVDIIYKIKKNNNYLMFKLLYMGGWPPPYPRYYWFLRRRAPQYKLEPVAEMLQNQYQSPAIAP